MKGLAASARIRKGTATRLGMTLADYDAQLAAGNRWCCGCPGWHPDAEFPPTGSYCRAAWRARNGGRKDRRAEEYRNWLLARVLVK